jgi:hypothetical protein
MRLGFFLLMITTLLACSRSGGPDTAVAITVKAEVINDSDLNCSLPVLWFGEDSIRVRAFTGDANQSFVVTGLPTHLNQVGQKLLVTVEKQQSFFACRTVGYNYPSLHIRHAATR